MTFNGNNQQPRVVLLRIEAIQTTFIGVPSAGKDLRLWLVEARGPHLVETCHAVGSSK